MQGTGTLLGPFVEVGEFYGVNPYSLTDDQLRTLYLGLPRAKAIRELRERTTQVALTGDALYDLVLKITRDESTAENVRAKFWLKELRAGRKPAGLEE